MESVLGVLGVSGQSLEVSPSDKSRIGTQNVQR